MRTLPLLELKLKQMWMLTWIKIKTSTIMFTKHLLKTILTNLMTRLTPIIKITTKPTLRIR